MVTCQYTVITQMWKLEKIISLYLQIRYLISQKHVLIRDHHGRHNGLMNRPRLCHLRQGSRATGPSSPAHLISQKITLKVPGIETKRNSKSMFDDQANALTLPTGVCSEGPGAPGPMGTTVLLTAHRSEHRLNTVSIATPWPHGDYWRQRVARL